MKKNPSVGYPLGASVLVVMFMSMVFASYNPHFNVSLGIGLNGIYFRVCNCQVTPGQSTPDQPSLPD